MSNRPKLRLRLRPLVNAKDTLLWQIENAYTRVRNFVRWLPIIWRDQHWDYHFMLELIAHKLEFMIECMSDDGMHVEQERLDEMREVADLLWAEVNGKYLTDATEKVKTKWGDFEMEFKKFDPEAEGLPPDKFLVEFTDFVFENAHTKGEQVVANEDLHQIWGFADMKRDKMWERLWMLMENKMQGWWD